MSQDKIFPYDVFVSYRWISPYQEWVHEQLRPALVDAGLTVCLDVEDFVPGRDLMLEMERAGLESRHVICVVTPEYFEEGRMVEFESLLARRNDPAGRKSSLIPLIVKETEIPERIRGLIPVYWTKSKDHPREWKRLLRALRATKLDARTPGIIPLSERGLSTDHPANSSIWESDEDNPFFWRGGITVTQDFFDRKGEQRSLRSLIKGRQSCQVVGPRRIGKTSLTRQISRVAPTWKRGLITAYVDSQDERCTTLAGWLMLVSREFKWSQTAASLAEFTELVEESLSQGQQPLLCIDEVEDLFNNNDAFPRNFFKALRACGQQGMSIVTASQVPLSDLTDPNDQEVSAFYNTFSTIRLNVFAEGDARDFLHLSRPGIPPFEPVECEAILSFAKGHPLALQVASFHVLESKRNGTSLAGALLKAEDDAKGNMPSGW